MELSNTGTVTTYCIVNVPFAGQSIEIPYICGQILLDGANLSFMGLLQEIPTDEVRMGLRVEAVWVPPEELGPTLGVGQVLPTHRRARRRLRDVQGVPVSRAVPRPDLGAPARRRGLVRAVRQRAARGRAQRGRDAHAGGRRGVRQHRHHQGRRRLHLLGLDRLPDRRPVLLRRRVGRRRACGRREPSPTSRWTAPGRSTRRGCCCRRGRSTPRWSTRFGRSSMGDLEPGHGCAARSRTTWRRCGPTRRRWPRCRPRR